MVLRASDEREHQQQVGTHELDICHAARGWKHAYDRTFHSIVPDADGNIVLRFSGGWDPLQKTNEAIVQAIEVLPESKSVARIDCGSDSSFVDWNSHVWDADRAFQGGKTIVADTPVSQASPTIYDQGLYRTARAGKSIGYTISVSPGFYTVQLKFAELWLAEMGKRPMDIEVNGRVIRNLGIRHRSGTDENGHRHPRRRHCA